MTHSPGPRANAPRTVRLEDQALPDREVAFYTPRAGDWLLLGVLVVALLAIGARVWSQLGWGDAIGRAIFFGLLTLAIYWAALIYIFKLSLAARVGPQGLAIVRGPWRVELRWSEITRLMERPQVSGGRRYRWVVALARDGRRIQVREDAVLDYERFRREVYERYRLWRDHGGTWGATGGGPFVARESVAGMARWWAFAALMVALLGLYLALLTPFAQLVGYALLIVALLGGLIVVAVLTQRRVYAIDGRTIESRGALERVKLAWRDVARVERTRHPAGGVILAAVAVGRLTLRLAARGDSGIRGFAWSPRVPEYLILRGGGRRARIRLHRLAQPEELLAWVEFYAGTRRAANSRPLEGAAQSAQASHGEQTTPRRTVVSSGPRRAPASGPLRQGVSSGPLRTPAASDASGAPPVEVGPDLSGASGPLDPWGGARRGEVVDAPAAPATNPPHTAASEPASPAAREPMPEPLFRGAPISASFHEPAGLDQPPAAAARQAASGEDSEAWLRETGALFTMNSASGGAPPAASAGGQVVEAASAPPPAAPPSPSASRGRQFVRPPVPPRRPAAQSPGGGRGARPPAGLPGQPPAGPRPTKPVLPDLPPTQPAATPAPQGSPFAPYNPDMPDTLEAREMLGLEERGAPPRTPPAEAEAVRRAPPTPAPVSLPAQDDFDEVEFVEGEGEDWTEGELPAQPAPWLQPGWQPPVLPRFGPQQAEPDGDEAPPGGAPSDR